MLLEKLVASELECALEEVTRSGGTESGQEGSGTICSDCLSDSADEAFVVRDWVELDSGFDALWFADVSGLSLPGQWASLAVEAAASSI